MPIDELFSRNTTRSPKDWLGPENWNLQAFMAQSQAWEAERLERQRKRRRFRHSADEMALHHTIRAALSRYDSHPSDWEPITDEESLYNLRAGERIQLFRQTRKGWEPLQELNGPRSGERVLAFRRRGAQSGGSAVRNHQPRTQPIRLTPEAYRRLGDSAEPEPGVHIMEPANDAVIEPDDSILCHRRVEWYAFQPGESAASVTRRYLGYVDPSAVYDGDMRVVADPQPGDSYQVFMGHLLRIEGRVANAKQVELAWRGPTEGRRTLYGTEQGSTAWSTEIPIRPGHYRVTARLDAGPQSRVDFDIVESEGSRMARTLGMAKELVNQSWRELSAGMIEGTGKEYDIRIPGEAGRRRVTAKELAERYRREGSDILSLSNPAEAAGAQTVRDNPQAPLAVGIIAALGSRGNSLLRHPQEFLDDLKRALNLSRSESEALGELGMRQAHRRLDIETDPRYVNRYHGPDEIGVDTRKQNRLTETEAKGSKNDRVRLSTNQGKRKQGSAKNNRKRAETMKKKERQGKVDQPSNRQGGPYQEGEMELWGEIFENEGEKQHILVHTNTTTGQVRTFEQVDGGKIGRKLDEFEMENFKEAKTMIEAHFTKMKGQVTK
jgi:hypothetical protein